MSRNRAPEAEDIWTRLQREKQQQLSQPSNDGPTATPTTTIGPDGQPIIAAPSSSTIQDSQAINQNLIFLGDGNSGKSSLIQTFLKPNAASKDTKPTVALEYNFARKTNNNNKYLAHFWEIGGDFIEPALLEIPLTKAALTCTTIIIVCDMSKPHNVVNSLIRSIAAIREVVNKRVAELQGTDNNKLKDFRDRIVETYKAHPDGNRVRPTEVPLVIIANKHDTLRALQSAEKKSLMQAIRFIAHYFGAALLTMSTSTAGDGSVMRESYRNLINAIAFSNHGALPTANYKPSCETNVEKGIVISRGQDNFHGILLGAGFSDDVDTGKIKVSRCQISLACTCLIPFSLYLHSIV